MPCAIKTAFLKECRAFSINMCLFPNLIIIGTIAGPHPYMCTNALSFLYEHVIGALDSFNLACHSIFNCGKFVRVYLGTLWDTKTSCFSVTGINPRIVTIHSGIDLLIHTAMSFMGRLMRYRLTNVPLNLFMSFSKIMWHPISLWSWDIEHFVDQEIIKVQGIPCEMTQKLNDSFWISVVMLFCLYWWMCCRHRTFMSMFWFITSISVQSDRNKWIPDALNSKIHQFWSEVVMTCLSKVVFWGSISLQANYPHFHVLLEHCFWCWRDRFIGITSYPP